MLGIALATRWSKDVLPKPTGTLVEKTCSDASNCRMFLYSLTYGFYLLGVWSFVSGGFWCGAIFLQGFIPFPVYPIIFPESWLSWISIFGLFSSLKRDFWFFWGETENGSKGGYEVCILISILSTILLSLSLTHTHSLTSPLSDCSYGWSWMSRISDWS